MTITAAADDYDRIVFGQIKNNLAARIMHSLHYHMTTQVVGYHEGKTSVLPRSSSSGPSLKHRRHCLEAGEGQEGDQDPGPGPAVADRLSVRQGEVAPRQVRTRQPNREHLSQLSMCGQERIGRTACREEPPRLAEAVDLVLRR